MKRILIALVLGLLLAGPGAAQPTVYANMWLPPTAAPRAPEEISTILRLYDDGRKVENAIDDVTDGLDPLPVLSWARSEHATRQALLDSLDIALADLRQRIISTQTGSDAEITRLNAVIVVLRENIEELAAEVERVSDTADIRVEIARNEGLALGRASGIEAGRALEREGLLPIIRELACLIVRPGDPVCRE